MNIFSNLQQELRACAIETSQEVRDYAEQGMAEMSEKFKEGGAEIYRPAGQ